MAKADEPTKKDLIGYRKIVDLLAELLTDDSTTFPLTIAVSAPWGGGKSSIMRMLGQELDEHPHGPEWLAVDFPAWRYETGEHWAAMAKATYDAGLRRLGFLDRSYSGCGWRSSRGSARPRGAACWRDPGCGLIGAFLGGQAAKAAGVQQEAGAAILGGAGGFIAVAQALWSSFVDPFKKAVESFAEKPGIRSGDGFTADAANQVDALMTQLLADGGRVAIFIDDLDRCTPRNLVRVIEAVNQALFIAGTSVADMPHPESRINRLTRRVRRRTQRVPERSRLVFIMGMDRHVVARGIEAEYAALKDRLDKAGDPAGLDYGLAFLDKIVQLWVTLPPPTYQELTTLLGKRCWDRPDWQRDRRCGDHCSASGTGGRGRGASTGRSSRPRRAREGQSCAGRSDAGRRHPPRGRGLPGRVPCAGSQRQPPCVVRHAGGSQASRAEPAASEAIQQRVPAPVERRRAI